MNNEKLELIVNAQICDTREASESTLSNYKDIVMNSSVMIQNKKSKELLSKCDIIFNVGTTISTEKDIIIKEDFKISPSTKIEENKTYIVNGNLEIEQKTEEVLEKIEKLYVLGSIKYPVSLENSLNNIVIDCKSTVYPDDCNFLDKKVVLDEMFEFTAEENELYFAKDQIVITNIDIEPILEKNIKFHSKSLIVDKSFAKKVIPLFNKDVEISILRDGQNYFAGNTSLDSDFVARFNGNIYVDGNAQVNAKSDIANIENLTVSGKLDVLESRQNDVLRFKCKKLNIVKGKIIEHCGNMSVDNTLLENSTDGITIRSCGLVKFEQEVKNENIIEKIQLSHCGYVECSNEQKSAVQLVANNVGHISTCEEKEERKNKVNSDRQVVNSCFYVL